MNNIPTLPNVPKAPQFPNNPPRTLCYVQEVMPEVKTSKGKKTVQSIRLVTTANGNTYQTDLKNMLLSYVGHDGLIMGEDGFYTIKQR